MLAELSSTSPNTLRYDWALHARYKQLAPPGDWDTWLLLAGRGFGKTRCGSEWVIEQARNHPGAVIALVAETSADARDVMVDVGDSSILRRSPPGFVPHFEPSKRRLTWPNGSVGILFSAEDPEQLRGPQFHFAWCDEIAKWKYPDTWDQLSFGMRLGRHPQRVATSTPRPLKWIKAIREATGTVVTRGGTRENAANLPGAFMRAIEERYAGTRLGRQELDAEDLEDVPGALWTRALLDETRVRKAPSFVRVVVGVDPAASSGEESAETGIVVAAKGSDGHGYVLADVSVRGTPQVWGKRGVDAYRLHEADRIVAEGNNGGEMVTHVLRTVDPHVPVKLVKASRGKITRAEPIAALYEQKRVHHVGVFADLEEQMATYVPDGTEASPDRMDALVWALTELFPNRSSASPITIVTG